MTRSTSSEGLDMDLLFRGPARESSSRELDAVSQISVLSCIKYNGAILKIYSIKEWLLSDNVVVLTSQAANIVTALDTN